MTCSRCGADKLVRRRRRLFERLWYAEVYQCRECGDVRSVRHWREWNWLSRTVQCPLCGNVDVQKLSERDGIDRMYPNPISRIQQLFGAPIYHCCWCRLQFYDLRPRPAVRS